MAEAIVISDYDSRWPGRYEREKSKILEAIGDKVVAIEHVGSTAVTGLGSKPIIDIMVGIQHLSDAGNCIELLKNISYEYVPEYEADLPERRYFRKGPVNAHFHLHMVEVTSDFWGKHLMFRDFLRAHPEAAEQYLVLKKNLADKYGIEHQKYTESKTPFIEGIIEKARAENIIGIRG